jgi:hypothetical protein
MRMGDPHWTIEVSEGAKVLRIRLEDGGLFKLAEAVIEFCHARGIEVQEIERIGFKETGQ